MLSYTELIIFGVAIAGLLDRFDILLLFFVVTGPIFWITQIVMFIRKYMKQNS
jgi:hypothetical protein